MLAAVVGRVHNAVSYPALRDWDADSHAVNVIAVLEGHLPNLRSWAGSHPPLYYATGAALWALAPEWVPVHVLLRLISVVAWIGTIALVWRALRWLGFRAEAGIVAALLLGIPGFVIASGMMTNDVLCVFFMTAALVRIVEEPLDEPASATRVVATALLAGLAAMTKATGLATIATVAAFYAWQSRRQLAVAARNVALVAVVTAVMLAPHFGRLYLARSAVFAEGSAAPASPYHVPGYDFLSGFSESEEKAAVSLVVLGVLTARDPHPSYGTMIHTAIWSDPTGVFLPPAERSAFALRGLSFGGLLVEAVALGGLVYLAWRRDLARRATAVLAFGAVYAAALVIPCIVAPHLLLTKTNFLIPMVLPLGLVLAAGMSAVRGPAAVGLRGALLVIAGLGVAVTWYGWWEGAPPMVNAADPPGRASAPPVRAVERYFADRARDPIRAVTLLDESYDQFRIDGLRLVSILRVPFRPERAPVTAAERALELARARQAWLALYNLVRWMQPVAAALDVTVTSAEQHGDTADVRVRVDAVGPTPPPAASELKPWPFPPFEQQLTLVQSDGEWRITRITQSGLAVENAVPAFVADPTLAGLDELRALGWRPDWEAAVESAVGRAP